MRCFVNYSPNTTIPIGRRESRCIYEDITPEQSARNAINYKSSILQYKQLNTLTRQQTYSYLINNPVMTLATQSDTYTNPNIKDLYRIYDTTVSINNNSECPYKYTMLNSASLPPYTPYVVYPIPIGSTLPTQPCINYVTPNGGRFTCNNHI